jgi:hypothetical protein
MFAPARTSLSYMKFRSLLPIVCTLAALPFQSLSAADIVETDICVYGGTSGGVTAAVQGARQGKTVALAVFNNHVGGMTSGGLGATDVGNHGNTYIQGLSREFYERISQRYGGTGARFNFEPKVAEAVFNTMLTEVGITPRWNQRLATVTKTGQRITEIAMEDGTIYRARMFIDATYEGDLMAKAGVSFAAGRESVAQYGESLNGIRASTPSHQFTVNVDPYVVPGNPASGLLPYIQPGNGGTPGDGDERIQAYNFRMCLTNNAANRLPIPAPPGYDEANYELLGRLIEARVAAGHSLTVTSFMNIASMPNSKTDINNNGAFSTDFIGMNHAYPSATHTEREAMATAHRNYIQGFFYYLGNSTRVPLAVRSGMLNYGFCKDEFLDTGGWPHQLYVREARRMVSDYVMIQQDCLGSRVAPDSIALSAYTMDSHNCQRIVQGGVVKNEGDVQSGTSQPFGISYRSIVPKVGECENLLVPWSLSASHIAFGSIRMEPVFMILAQSAASAAVIAIDDNIAVQQVSYPKLVVQLLADKQRLTWSTDLSGGVIVDNSDATGVTITGAWTTSTSKPGYWGGNYITDNNELKGSKSVRFTPNLPAAGDYDVYLRWTTDPNRPTNVPVDVITSTGTQTFTINQQQNNGIWFLLGRMPFDAGTNGSLLIRTTGTAVGTFVIADAARWVAPGIAATKVEIVASDAVTREGAIDGARVTLLRTGEEATNALTVQYTLGGTAQNGTDVQSLSGVATFAAGSTTATIPIQAIGDALAEGTETVTLTVQSGAGYTTGPVASATVQVLDRPIDAWRHASFSPTELADPAISGNEADPDGDTATNLEEYALARNPLGADVNGITKAMDQGSLTLTYHRRKAATDTDVIVEGSLTLGAWETTGRVQEIARIDEGATQRITVRLLQPIPSERGFLRVRRSAFRNKDLGIKKWVILTKRSGGIGAQRRWPPMMLSLN